MLFFFIWIVYVCIYLFLQWRVWAQPWWPLTPQDVFANNLSNLQQMIPSVTEKHVNVHLVFSAAEQRCEDINSQYMQMLLP